MIWINTFKMFQKCSNRRNACSQHSNIFSRSALLFTAITFQILLEISPTFAQVPADHLVPPPLPPQPQSAPAIHTPSTTPFLPNPQALTHNRQQRQPQLIPLNIANAPSSYAVENGPDQSGIMTRIARWFGFAHNAQEQQLIAAGTVKHPAYSYPKPQDQLNYNQKAPCSLCNKYPWIPMMPLSVQYPPTQQQHINWQQQQHQQQHIQHQYQQQHQQAQASKPAPAFVPISQVQQIRTQQQPIKQRAVQFQFPKAYQNYQATLQQPLLTTNPSPPIYNAQPFHTTTSLPYVEQQLPTTEPAHFTENIGAHSELKLDQVNPNGGSNVEIIKSQQVTDFVSSIEYPATFVRSQSIDLNLVQPTADQKMPENHKNEAVAPFGTVSYQHVAPHITNHVPASQLLTDPGRLTSTTLNFDTTDTPLPSTLPPPNHKQYEEPNSADNFPSASSFNKHDPYQANEIFYTTTEYPQGTELFSTTQKSALEFAPSSQTNEGNHNFKPLLRDRGTPKRLLDAPIQHAQHSFIGSPRPFTRDPSELDYRLGAISLNQQQPPPNQNFQQQHTTSTPWVPTVTPAPAFAVSSADPTPTSTYGALDASGQYAGMSPPPMAPVPAASKNVQQIIVPYTTKSRPRPFEPSRNVIESSTHRILMPWQQNHFAQNVDLHEQQESKVVINTVAENPTTTRPTTAKYVTKVLASNLRELLRREQAFKNRSNSHAGFDLSKLQKNIDDWTEQEYTSLSHRASTPTIRGRSKHIPVEYLTTTTTTPAPATKPFKSAHIFDSTALSTSINNLESLKANERGSKRFEYPSIEENIINELEKAVTKATTGTITATTPTTQHTSPIYVRPVPTQPPPEILWQKAKVLISPETHEKLYVVTPQPRFFPQRVVTTSTEAEPPLRQSTSSSARNTGRFIVRPTPGNGSSSTNTTLGLYSPAPFGLSGLSAFVPAQPVEIIDGNSKVVTIVTPSSDHKTELAVNTNPMVRPSRNDYVTINRSLTKPTMSPSPR